MARRHGGLDAVTLATEPSPTKVCPTKAVKGARTPGLHELIHHSGGPQTLHKDLLKKKEGMEIFRKHTQGLGNVPQESVVAAV